jgi:hypothetical protein
MKALVIFLLLPIFSISQNLSEFQLIDWDNNLDEKYTQMPSGSSTLKKHKKKYHLFTVNLLVDELVNNQLDTLRTKRNLKPRHLNSETTWTWRVLSDFTNQFSDSLKQPVILRKKTSGENCQKCAESIVDLIKEDSTMMSILMSKKLKRSYTAYFQMSFDGDWKTSFLVVYYKMVGRRTRFFYYELPEDTK